MANHQDGENPNSQALNNLKEVKKTNEKFLLLISEKFLGRKKA
jgi:hypothetical protein